MWCWWAAPAPAKSSLLDLHHRHCALHQGQRAVRRAWTPADNRNAFEAVLGYVPQKDIMHDNLTVEQSLTFTAKLRIAHDASQGRDQRCRGPCD